MIQASIAHSSQFNTTSKFIQNKQYYQQVPMVGAIDSLNVSQAAGVFLYEMRKKIDAAMS